MWAPGGGKDGAASVNFQGADSALTAYLPIHLAKKVGDSEMNVPALEVK